MFITDEIALKNFLMDIECLDSLSAWVSKVNIFDILKISNNEIRHSNMLAWLLDPNELHGFGDLILNGLFQYIVKNNESNNIFDILLMDYYSFSVLREWNNIDLLIVSTKEKCVICIENKVFSDEHDDQLNKYKNIVNDTYDNAYKKYFLYLTPEGDDSSDNQLWISISYNDITSIISKNLKRVELPQLSALMIDNYIDIVRKTIVGDEKLIEICNEIYLKHRQALDLIFDNKFDTMNQLNSMIKEWCKNKTSQGTIIFDNNQASKRNVSFTTPIFKQIIPDVLEMVGGWRTNNFFSYSIRLYEDKFRVIFEVCNINITDSQRKDCDKLISLIKPSDKRINWTWKTLKSWKSYKITDIMTNEAKEYIFSKLDDVLCSIIEFEKDIVNKWN